MMKIMCLRVEARSMCFPSLLFKGGEGMYRGYIGEAAIMGLIVIGIMGYV